MEQNRENKIQEDIIDEAIDEILSLKNQNDSGIFDRCAIRSKFEAAVESKHNLANMEEFEKDLRDNPETGEILLSILDQVSKAIDDNHGSSE